MVLESKSNSMLVAMVAVALLAVPARTDRTVWPKPQHETVHPGAEYILADVASFRFDATGVSSQMLLEAFERYEAIVFGSATPDGGGTGRRLSGYPTITSIQVNVKSADETLALSTDESYTLTIQAPASQIEANTVYGALHALETFSQKIDRIFINGTTIHDFPRFHFRASMIDTSRHWYPLTTIKQHLDAMAYAKMNVMHWHIVDSVSFPYCSTTFPSLCKDGAYTERSIYLPEDVKEIVSYAKSRGIRVLPEFDTPGHVFAGIKSIPNLLTPCYGQDGRPDGTFGPLNPILPSTYEFLEKFYFEVKQVFPDKFVHVGGDEVSFDCWQSNPDITKWMDAHPEIKDYAALESYYEVQLLKILEAQNSSYMVWEEIFDNGVKILPDTVVDVWKGGWQTTMGKAVASGFNTVLSAPFYLNCWYT